MENAMPEENSNSSFMIEKIKERPLNRRKLIRRTLITALMAVIFGTIACVTFLLLEPIISNRLYPEDEPQSIIFPEDLDEITPEQMLSDSTQQENKEENLNESKEYEADEERLQELLSEISLTKDNYEQLYKSLYSFVYSGNYDEDMNALNQSIVTIKGIKSGIDWFDNVQESSNQTSGVIIADNGRDFLILVDYTNLKNAESLVLELDDGYYQVDAELKGYDKYTNLAVVAVNQSDIPVDWMETGGLAVAEIGSSNKYDIVGTPVIAIGSPMGSEDSVGYGIISAQSDVLSKVDMKYTLLQTNIYGSQNASGVLFNMKGQLIGIITTGENSSDMKNIITAYGISDILGRIQKMSNGEKIAYIGITGVNVTPSANSTLNVPYGVYVTDTDIDSPAMLAGIRQGDVIIKIGEKNISSLGDYVSVLLQLDIGDTADVTVMRLSQDEYREITFNIVVEGN
jgi:serine protease Do